MTDTTRPLTGYVAHIDVSPDDDQAPTLTVCLDHPCPVVPVGAVTITPDHPAPAEVVNRHPRHELGMTVSQLLAELEARVLSGGGDVPVVVEGIRGVRGVMTAPGEDGRLVVVLS